MVVGGTSTSTSNLMLYQENGFGFLLLLFVVCCSRKRTRLMVMRIKCTGTSTSSCHLHEYSFKSSWNHCSVHDEYPTWRYWPTKSVYKSTIPRAIFSWCIEPYVSCIHFRKVVFASSRRNRKFLYILGLDCSSHPFHEHNMFNLLSKQRDIWTIFHCAQRAPKHIIFLEARMHGNFCHECTCTISILCNSVYFYYFWRFMRFLHHQIAMKLDVHQK